MNVRRKKKSSTSVYLKIGLAFSLLLNFGFVGYKIKKYQDAKHSLPVDATSKPINYNYSRQTIYDLFPIASTNYVFIGDSQTHRFDFFEFFPEYPIIKNRGIEGDITDGVIKRMDKIIAGHPKKVFLEIGFNDLGHGIGVDSIVKNLDSITTAFKTRSPQTKLYLQNILPCGVLRGGINVKILIPELNKKVYALAKKHSIIFIDINTPLNKNDALNPIYDCGDGVHLNGNAYVVWAGIIKKYL